MASLKVVSLFSGCGGSSLGYKLAGFEVLAANEFVDFQAENYRRNFPDARVYESDIRKLSPSIVFAGDLGLKRGELDVLDGSPPCASFSMSGKRDKHWGEEKKYSNTKQRTDDLFFEYVRFLKAAKPKVFVAENVPGLISGVAKGYFKEIYAALEDAGYNVRARVLNAADYGVPQNRRRLFFLGVRRDLELDIPFPDPVRPVKTLRDALTDLPARNEEEAEFLREASKKHEGGVLGVLRKIPKNPTKPISGADYADGSYFNLIRSSLFYPAPTITATNSVLGSASLTHPTEDRKFTVTELKRIATFPDDFELTGDYSRQAEAIGRSVPPLLMKALAANIRNALE